LLRRINQQRIFEEDDAYFVTVLRYIWQTPVKAGPCSDATEYPWSSVQLLGSTDTPMSATCSDGSCDCASFRAG
jgi:hypothetical protein